MRELKEDEDEVARSSENSRSVRLESRLALRPREAAAALGVGERTLRQLLPKLPHLREGGVVLIPVDALREWLRERAETKPAQVDAVVREVLDDLADDA